MVKKIFNCLEITKCITISFNLFTSLLSLLMDLWSGSGLVSTFLTGLFGLPGPLGSLLLTGGGGGLTSDGSSGGKGGGGGRGGVSTLGKVLFIIFLFGFFIILCCLVLLFLCGLFSSSEELLTVGSIIGEEEELFGTTGIGGVVIGGIGLIEAVHVDGSPQLHRLDGTAA